MTAMGHKRERRPRRRPASHAAGVPQLADSLLAGREGSALGQERSSAFRAFPAWYAAWVRSAPKKQIDLPSQQILQCKQQRGSFNGASLATLPSMQSGVSFLQQMGNFD